MKTHITVLWFSLISFAMLLLSCAPSIEGITPSFVATSSQPPRRATIVSSLTPLPTHSPTPLPTVPPIMPTPTMIPTLPVETAQIKLLDLLANNGNCRLPCLWGIMPGESTFWEAQAILASLSGLSPYADLNFPGPSSISPTYNESGLEIYTRITYLINPESKITNRIVFNLEAHRSLQEGGYEDVYDSKSFGNKTSVYGLPHVLSEQGIPSSVMIATWGGPLTRGFTGGFGILLLYPDKGVLVNYNTQMYVIGSNVRGCPVNAHVEMELYPPGQQETFFELLKKTDWNTKMKYYQPLEEVTSMTLGEFYEAFREQSSRCIETPANFWPTPEP